ncbi:membrane protein [Nonlabens ulvanivorans]|nr:DUF2723 domain-containing protein [Nonlabens ulvanivorans]GAK90152.1 membrane protein [Nonlabens ulvanivorans]
MKLNYNQLNKIAGWIVFAIALITYWLTVEPTVSFWDAGEYIATSSGLQVGHPPGAPLYQMLGAFFSMFALDKSQIAYMVNMMSVFSSAFTILFMFWSLTLLLKRHILKEASNDLMILGASAIGSLAYTFSDSFWFNAVEAEVYAPAALLMSALFYMGLLWERDMFLPRGNKWLVLISFTVGLSFGVHFMGILTIPAIGMLWYFKHYKKITPLNFVIANISVVAVLLFVFKLLLPYTLSIFGYMEVFFVNDIGLPFNSGSIIMLLLVVALFIFLIRFSRKQNKPLLNTITLCVMFVLIGFSSWTMLPIRANAGTPINENNPNDARALLAYYNREQYPAPALFYGEAFTDIYAGLDPESPYLDEKPKYEKDYKLGKYVIVNNFKNSLQNTHDDHKGLFPRMTDPSRATNYIDFIGGLNYYVKPEYASSMELQTVLADYKRNYENGRIGAQEYVDFLVELREAVVIEKPDGLDNASYFLNYQVQYMYLRYFMWNFTGRQNDIQGEGDPFNGNWISGIPFIDEWHLGTQDNLSEDMLNNKGRNTYFFLPLILGLIGMIFHAKKDLKSFYVTLVLFLFTGLAIIVYLNQSMYQVRERDYAYVGSFLVFAMWIGMGVYAIYEGIKDSISVKTARVLSITICFVAVPLLMAFQNWDDHDRSGKYSALTSAKKYLDSCLPDALIFTIGDNDTFPLWYLQEVEGYRTDVRVVCTSLLATDWYMDDMKKKAWDSDPVPSTITHDKYTYGTRDALWYADKERVMQRTGGKSSLPDTLDLKDWMEWVVSDKKITQEQMRNDHWEHTFPTKFIRIPVNKEAVLKNGVVPQRDADKIVDEIVIEINSSLVYKNRMFMLDIINANNWERPIYFSGGAFGDDDYIWMKDYLQLDGCAFRLLPIKTEPENRRDPFDMGRVDPDHGYEILKKWDWGGNSGNPDIYYDVETRRNSVGYRSNVTRVAEALTKAGDYKRAEEILDLGMEKMPLDLYGHYSMIEPFVNGYYEVGQIDKAQDLLDRVILKYQDEIDFYKALDIDERRASYSDIIAAVERYRSLVESAIFYEDDKMVQKHKDVFNQYVLEFTQFYSPEETIGGTSREEIPTSELDNIFQEATDNTVTEDMIETNPQDTP